jgi:hypothetical protein
MKIEQIIIYVWKLLTEIVGRDVHGLRFSDKQWKLDHFATLDQISRSDTNLLKVVKL